MPQCPDSWRGILHWPAVGLRHSVRRVQKTARGRPNRAALAGLALLSIVAAVGVVVAQRPGAPPFQELDSGWRNTLISERTGWATDLAYGVHLLGDTIGATLVALALAAYFWRVRRQPAAALFVVLALFAARLVTNSAKLLVGRPRPPEMMVSVYGYSFPSGHVSTATALAVAVAVILAYQGRVRWGAALVVLAPLVMIWNRTYLSVHWLSDAMLGMAAGGGAALLVWWVLAPRLRGRQPQGRPVTRSTSP